MRAAWCRPIGAGAVQQRPCLVITKTAKRAFIEYEDLSENPPAPARRWVPLDQVHGLDEPPPGSSYASVRNASLLAEELGDLARLLNQDPPPVADLPFSLTSQAAAAPPFEPGLPWDRQDYEDEEADRDRRAGRRP